MTRLAWFAIFGSIAAWMAHLVFEASLVRYTCNADHEWVLHAATAVTGVAALAALGASWRVMAVGAGDESDNTPGGRLRFLGTLGLIVSAANLTLIVLEGAYVFALKPCA